jgi:hypothetical protein
MAFPSPAWASGAVNRIDAKIRALDNSHKRSPFTSYSSHTWFCFRSVALSARWQDGKVMSRDQSRRRRGDGLPRLSKQVDVARAVQ